MIRTLLQPTFIVDSESERNSSWPDCLVYCLDTTILYSLKNTVFTNVSSSAMPFDYVEGVKKSSIFWLVKDGTTTNGVSTIYLTTDGTSSGTAMFSEIHGINIILNDSASVWSDSYSISNDNKVLTVTLKKMATNLVTILGISVVSSLTLNASPNGTALKVVVTGK